MKRRRQPRATSAGGPLIGHGRPCFVAAEVGINHNGELDLAIASIDAAVETGADAVKFQNYRTEDFVFDRSLTYEYESGGRIVSESQYEMFKRCELSSASLSKLARHARQRNITIFSTPTSEAGVDELVSLNFPLLKNGSDYLQHLPLIRKMGQSGIPTVISTGMATLAEVDDAVRAFEGGGGKELVILHCTSSYPTPPEDVHLRKIATLHAAFGYPVGLSDHTEGTAAAVGAVALGACMIEKHFTVDKSLPGPDHRFSADPAEFARLVADVRAVERSLGSSVIRPANSELKSRKEYRLSCVAARDLNTGEVLAAADVVISRPGGGIPPIEYEGLPGRRLRRPVARGNPLTQADLS